MSPYRRECAAAAKSSWKSGQVSVPRPKRLDPVPKRTDTVGEQPHRFCYFSATLLHAPWVINKRCSRRCQKPNIISRDFSYKTAEGDCVEHFWNPLSPSILGLNTKGNLQHVIYKSHHHIIHKAWEFDFYLMFQGITSTSPCGFFSLSPTSNVMYVRRSSLKWCWLPWGQYFSIEK